MKLKWGVFFYLLLFEDFPKTAYLRYNRVSEKAHFTTL